jgi:prepilin-type processing-associated H-X9-DG protein
VMELVEGESLADRLAKGPLRTVDALGTAREIAEGLMAAWAHGVAHGDLRPKNVLLADGHVKLTDFMLAPPVEGTESVRGTPQYMAPELLVGTPPDALSDIYALGCTLFEILVGRPVYKGSTGTVLHMQAHEPPPSLEKELPGAPQFLVDLLARFLEKDRAKRLKTYTEVLAAIDRALQGASLPAMQKPQIPDLDIDMDIEGDDDLPDEKTAEIHSSPARDLLDGEPLDEPRPRPAPLPAFADQLAEANTLLRPMSSAGPAKADELFGAGDDELDLGGGVFDDKPAPAPAPAAQPDLNDLDLDELLNDESGEATRIAPEIAKPAPLAFGRPQAAAGPAPVEVNVAAAPEAIGVYRSKPKSIVEALPEPEPAFDGADEPSEDLIAIDDSADDGTEEPVEEDLFAPDDSDFDDATSAEPGIAPAAVAMEPAPAPAPHVPSADEIGLELRPADADEIGLSLEPVDGGGDGGLDLGGLPPLDTDFLSAPLEPEAPPVLPVMPGGLSKKRP